MECGLSGQPALSVPAGVHRETDGGGVHAVRHFAAEETPQGQPAKTRPSLRELFGSPVTARYRAEDFGGGDHYKVSKENAP